MLFIDWLYRYWSNTRIFPFTKSIISSSRKVKILFLSFTCEGIGVAMVTNMISQLQESFPLRSAAGSFETSFTKWLRGAKTVRLPVTFSMSCQILTSILFLIEKWSTFLFKYSIKSQSMYCWDHYQRSPYPCAFCFSFGAHQYNKNEISLLFPAQ